MDVLRERAYKMGTVIGMTQDAMLSQLKTSQEEKAAVMNKKCTNIASLSKQHGERCRQVVKKGDSIVDGYLKK
jgi:hypothetical protein